MDKSASDFNLNSTSLVRMVWNKKYLFIIVGVVAFIASAVAGFLLTPYFKSTAILIPAVSTQASKELFVPSSRQKGLTVFGDDEEVEHLLQVLTSETLRRVVIEKLDLFTHYYIEPNSKQARFRVNRAFSNSVTFSPTKFRSVRIDVVDPDPNKAAKIANCIVVVADSLMRSSKRDVAQSALEVLEAQYQIALEESQRLQDSLSAVMARGVLDLPMQSKELYRAYFDAVARGDENASRRLEKQAKTLAGSGGAFHRYFFEIENNAEQIMEIKEGIHILQAEVKAQIPSQFIIDWAYPTDKKDSPKIMMIVIVSTLSALFFTLVLMLLYEIYHTSIKPKRSED